MWCSVVQKGGRSALQVCHDECAVCRRCSSSDNSKVLMFCGTKSIVVVDLALFNFYFKPSKYSATLCLKITSDFCRPQLYFAFIDLHKIHHK